jgi:hypothetical protein
MIEKPLDRLNYYNGQRLEASDLKLEQEYHIRTRRWLNKSLYTAGIARGLDIRAEKDSRFVIVSPGLALDTDGREILLLEEEHIFVPGKVQTTGGSEAKVEGLYLTIRYNDEAIQEERNGCIPKSTNGKKNVNRVPWGGPALVRAKPVFNWSDALPYDSSGKILLGEVELTADCTKVHQIHAGVRRYVGAASSAKVHQYALEGERHIDKNNPGRIYFHVRGRQPNSVTLYLRAEKFSTLHYTEMGRHTHGVSGVATRTRPANTIDAHSHTLTQVGTTDEQNHTHDDFQATYFGDDGRTNNCAISLVNLGNAAGELPPNTQAGQGNLARKVSTDGTESMSGPRLAPASPPTTLKAEVRGASPHKHDLAGTGGSTAQTDSTPIPQGTPSHVHPIDTLSLSIGYAGANDTPVPDGPASPAYSARSGAPLTYVNDLQILIDGVPVKEAIVAQLKDADATWFTYSQDKLGNGLENHPLVMDPITKKGGTGEIKLDILPNIYFLDGEHSIELSVKGDGNGGRILYNLYVE